MSSLFGDISIEDFLRDYWQKKPLLVRQAIPGFRSPLRPEELAGLALEDSVDSRLILEKGGEYPWELRYGPFDERIFRKLPSTHWTLLVQEVDRLIPEVGALLDRFRFIPDWRIDDVMVSYAPDKGGVGAHIDNYDVFLLQGMGKRRWQINYTPVEEEHLLPDLDVSILADFEPDEDWVLEPGDMLYLPPRIAHYGVAEGDCMTYSIGFRAPTDFELLSGFTASGAELDDESLRYGDPDLQPTSRPGYLDPNTLADIRSAIRRALADDQAIDRWFGEYITESRRGFYPPPAEEELTVPELKRLLASSAEINRAPGVRMAYFEAADGITHFFAAGESFELDGASTELAALIANRRSLNAADLVSYSDRQSHRFICELVNLGFLEIEV